jgi:hypothetical protein
MISFIVPTIWKSNNTLYPMIESYVRAEISGAEFILIDNAHGCYLHPQITTLTSKENLYVNKSWNIGVQIARNEYVCLLNDDIEISFETIKHNLDKIKNLDFGIIGFDANQNLSETVDYPIYDFKFEEVECRPLGFGCMMIMKKENYIPIDERLKIFFGDDILYWWNKDKNGKKIYTIPNLKVHGALAVSSKDYENEMQIELPYCEEVIRNLQNG